MAREGPDWETQLWSYLSTGDGKHCPLADTCGSSGNGSKCPDVNLERLNRLIAGEDQFDPEQSGHATICAGGSFPHVEKLAQQRFIEGRIDHPPIPTDLVAVADETRPIDVRSLDLRACDAATWRLTDGWVIQVSSTAGATRNRVALFHEAFHIIAHTRSQATPVFGKLGATQGAFNELLADYFAMCVLMPREWVTEHWPGVKDLDRMAETFDVPRSTMWLRLNELELVG